MSKYADIIAALEAADKPDGRLNEMVMKALFGVETAVIAPYTSDLDLALKLLELKLKRNGARCVDASLPHQGITVDVWDEDDVCHRGDHKVEAIATLIAMFRALERLEEGNQ